LSFPPIAKDLHLHFLLYILSQSPVNYYFLFQKIASDLRKNPADKSIACISVAIP